jgi:hypothetical protein
MIHAARCNKDPLILNYGVRLVRHPNPAWDVYDTRGKYEARIQIRLSVTAWREITERSEVGSSAAVSLRIGRPQWARSPFVFVWRDQVADGWRRTGNKQSGYTFLELPVSLCDTLMLASLRCKSVHFNCPSFGAEQSKARRTPASLREFDLSIAFAFPLGQSGRHVQGTGTNRSALL